MNQSENAIVGWNASYSQIMLCAKPPPTPRPMWTCKKMKLVMQFRMSARLVNKDGETETFSLTGGENLSHKIDGLRKLVNDRKRVGNGHNTMCTVFRWYSAQVLHFDLQRKATCFLANKLPRNILPIPYTDSQIIVILRRQKVAKVWRKKQNLMM